MKAVLEAQGQLLWMRVPREQRPVYRRPGSRKPITEFSSAARRNLLRFMARIAVSGIRTTFITLTFHEPPTPLFAKVALKRFLMRVRRRSAQTSGVWRMEFQPGRGAIHFHLLLFNLDYWKQAELQSVWQGCTEEQMSIVDIRLVHNHRMMMNYTAKYISKRDKSGLASLDDVSNQHAPRDSLIGRHWGWINKNALPLGEMVGGVLTDFATIKMIADYAWSIVGSDNRYGSLSFHLFEVNAVELCYYCLARGGLEWDEWRDGRVSESIHYSNEILKGGGFWSLNP